MITTKIYEDQSGDMAAVVLEDGEYSNYVPSPEMAAFEGDGFIEEARMGFPEAFPYEFDLAIGLTMEEAAAKAEQEYTLVAQIDDTVVGIAAVLYAGLFPVYTENQVAVRQKFLGYGPPDTL